MQKVFAVRVFIVAGLLFSLWHFDGHYLWLNDVRTTVPLRTRIRSVRGREHRVRFLQTGVNVELVLDEGGRGWLREGAARP